MPIYKGNIAAIVLAGGQGKRLYPLTMNHCKPAVPFGGRYRIIDIPISNALNSNIRRMYVLAQYLTSELQHHLQQTYVFDSYLPGSIDFLTPEEKGDGEKKWFEGTADAIRQTLPMILKAPVDYYLILSGDQLYNIDFADMFAFAEKSNADLTIAAIHVGEEDAKRMGLLKLDKEANVVDFYEKPQEEAILKQYRLPNAKYLGSMGIYIFKRDSLIKLLKEDDREDFGKHLIPTEIKKGKKTVAYLYNGYWEDIGTIQSFYNANLALIKDNCGLDTYNEKNPIFAKPNHLPGPRIKEAKVTHSLLSDGAIIEGKEIHNSIIGIRCHVGKGTVVRDSVILGSHSYSPPKQYKEGPKKYGIGQNCLIEKAIIDEHVYIGNNVQLVNKKNLVNYDGDGIFIRDGIIVVASGTVIPDNFVL